MQAECSSEFFLAFQAEPKVKMEDSVEEGGREDSAEEGEKGE